MNMSVVLAMMTRNNWRRSFPKQYVLGYQSKVWLCFYASGYCLYTFCIAILETVVDKAPETTKTFAEHEILLWTAAVTRERAEQKLFS